MEVLEKDTIFINTSQDLHSIHIHAKNFTHPFNSAKIQLTCGRVSVKMDSKFVRKKKMSTQEELYDAALTHFCR